MSRNGSGTYTLPSGNPVVSGTLIEATWANSTLSDIASALTDSLSRSGQGGMTAALRLFDGTSSVPGLAWGSETTTGWYRAGAGDMRLVVTGSEIMRYQSTGVGITGTLSVSGNTTLSGGTSNGVAYLNGSKVLTSGSALTFDGTTLANTTADNSINYKAKAASGVLRLSGYTPAYSGSLLEATNAAESAYAQLTSAASTFVWSINGSGQAATLTSTGLGIGTSSPGAKLESLQRTIGASAFRARYNSSSYWLDLLMDANGNAVVSVPAANGVTNGALQLKTNGGAATLDSSGNLGLGVTPSAWSSTWNAYEVRAGDTNSYIAGAPDESVVFGVNGYYDTSWKYKTTGFSASNYYQLNGTHVWRTAPSGTAGNAISFTQAMTLDASGNLALGTTTAIGKFTVYKAGSSYSDSLVLSNDSTFGANQGIAWGSSANISGRIKGVDDGAYGTNLIFETRTGGPSTSTTERARIDSSGNLLPGADNAYSCGNSGRRWNAIWAAIGTIQTSDEREKTEIVDSPLGLDFIKSLRPVAYKFKVGGNVVSTDEEGNEVITSVPGKRQHFGLLAQQVKQALGDTDFGGWILTDTNDTESEQGLRYDEFISPLIKAIQEQQAIINTQAAALEQLKADVAALKAAA